MLLISVDDLRPELGCYGSRHTHSPHIDRLAARGLLFERAYCQQALCNPSRTSLLTGLRPDRAGVTANNVHFRETVPHVVTLPEHFRRHGYHTEGIGKVYHGVFPAGSSRSRGDHFDDPRSWSVPPFKPGPRYYYTPAGIAQAREAYRHMYRVSDPTPDEWTTRLVFGPMTEAPDVDDALLYDGQVAERALRALERLRDRPFFLAVGFIKPHTPFVAPAKYWNLYRPAELSLATQGDLPTSAPPLAGHNSAELRRYTDQPKQGAFTVENARRLRHGYYACVSYIDAQVGLLLDGLARHGLSERTIVVLYGDHGWHLGEYGLWGKQTNFELAARVPLIVSAPGPHAGARTSALAELLDLYPTLCELAALPHPEHLQGRSLVPVFREPKRPGKRAAFTQCPRGAAMGYSLRCDVWRYTEWIERDHGACLARELYNHRNDPGETKNLAPLPQHANQVAALAKQLTAARTEWQP